MPNKCLAIGLLLFVRFLQLCVVSLAYSLYPFPGVPCPDETDLPSFQLVEKGCVGDCDIVLSSAAKPSPQLLELSEVGLIISFTSLLEDSGWIERLILFGLDEVLPAEPIAHKKNIEIVSFLSPILCWVASTEGLK